MIKLLTSWSNPGGSTIAHIRLCNLFNENGIECEMYGQHEWHLNKCKGKLLSEYVGEEDDVLITHFLMLKGKPKCKKHILSIHETNLFPLKELAKNPYFDLIDSIHYVSPSQRKWHSVNKTYKIIPNVVEEITLGEVDPREEKVAAVIGSIDPHKQTHLSIQRALDEGFKTVLLFGRITDIPYGIEHKDLIYQDKVKVMGHYDDQAKMYAMVDKVFHSSQRETFNFIKAECEQLKIPYDGLESADTDAQYQSKEEILEKWLTMIR